MLLSFIHVLTDLLIEAYTIIYYQPSLSRSPANHGQLPISHLEEEGKDGEKGEKEEKEGSSLAFINFRENEKNISNQSAMEGIMCACLGVKMERKMEEKEQ